MAEDHHHHLYPSGRKLISDFSLVHSSQDSRVSFSNPDGSRLDRACIIHRRTLTHLSSQSLPLVLLKPSSYWFPHIYSGCLQLHESVAASMWSIAVGHASMRAPVAQSCLTLHDPHSHSSPQAPLFIGFFQATKLE